MQKGGLCFPRMGGGKDNLNLSTFKQQNKSAIGMDILESFSFCKSESVGDRSQMQKMDILLIPFSSLPMAQHAAQRLKEAGLALK